MGSKYSYITNFFAFRAMLISHQLHPPTTSQSSEEVKMEYPTSTDIVPYVYADFTPTYASHTLFHFPAHARSTHKVRSKATVSSIAEGICAMFFLHPVCLHNKLSLSFFCPCSMIYVTIGLWTSAHPSFVFCEIKSTETSVTPRGAITVVWGLYFIANACSNTGKIFLSGDCTTVTAPAEKHSNNVEANIC